MTEETIDNIILLLTNLACSLLRLQPGDISVEEVDAQVKIVHRDLLELK